MHLGYELENNLDFGSLRILISCIWILLLWSPYAMQVVDLRGVFLDLFHVARQHDVCVQPKKVLDSHSVEPLGDIVEFGHRVDGVKLEHALAAELTNSAEVYALEQVRLNS